MTKTDQRSTLTVLHGTWAHTSQPFRVAVAWSPALNLCPGCGQDDRPTERDCPVATDGGNPGGDGWLPYDQQHGCGTWWGPLTGEAQLLEDDDDAHTVLAYLAQVVGDTYDTAIADLRGKVRLELARELAVMLSAVAALNPPPDGDEINELATGSDTNPGIWNANPYSDRDPSWEAWAYDPDGSGDTITVVPSDLPAVADELRSRLTRIGERRAVVEAERAEITSALRDLVPVARAVGLGAIDIARRTGLSRQAVYDIVGDIVGVGDVLGGKGT